MTKKHPLPPGEKYNLAIHHKRAGELLARLAREAQTKLEDGEKHWYSEYIEQQSLVISAVIESFCYVEVTLNDILSDSIVGAIFADKFTDDGRKILSALSSHILREPNALKKYQMLLQMLGYEIFEVGKDPYQAANILRELRNELVHFKPTWNFDEEVKRWDGKFRGRFKTESNLGFPENYLTPECAAWAVDTAVVFVNAFYDRCEVPESRREKIFRKIWGES